MCVLNVILFSSADVFVCVCVCVFHWIMVYSSFCSPKEGIYVKKSWKKFSDLSTNIYKVYIHLIIYIAKWY